MTCAGSLLAWALLGLVLTAGSTQAQDAPVAPHVLPNGLTVLVRENAAVGAVARPPQVRAGALSETEAPPGITTFLPRALVRGTLRRTAVELATSAEDIGGSL